MAIVNGPKLGLLYNCNIDEYYADNFRPFLQALDALIMANVINATTVVPPTSPNPGDAYLLVNTPSGAWTGKQNSIAVWSAQVTNTGTNVTNPQWVFYTPNAGWFVWNIATASQLVWNGSAWVSLAAGANYPVNTNITSMTGLTNQTINSSGYAYNDGTDPATAIGAKWSYGSPTFGTGSGVVVASQAWTGTSVTDYGVGVFGDSGQFSLVSPELITTSGTVEANTVISLGIGQINGQLQLGSGSAGLTGVIVARGSSNSGISIGSDNMTAAGVAVQIASGSSAIANGVGLLGFDSHYPTQSTVGSAGSASAPPANPLIWLQMQVYVSGTPTTVVVPCYKQS